MVESIIAMSMIEEGAAEPHVSPSSSSPLSRRCNDANATLAAARVNDGFDNLNRRDEVLDLRLGPDGRRCSPHQHLNASENRAVHLDERQHVPQTNARYRNVVPLANFT